MPSSMAMGTSQSIFIPSRISLFDCASRSWVIFHPRDHNSLSGQRFSLRLHSEGKKKEPHNKGRGGERDRNAQRLKVAHPHPHKKRGAGAGEASHILRERQGARPAFGFILF